MLMRLATTKARQNKELSKMTNNEEEANERGRDACWANVLYYTDMDALRL